ncbi:NrdH-redoxin [bacterium]|nr:NrdH-redoxin [Parcubacteria group bacterium]MBF05612.1 NrdH-redoxin [bacterium]|tara:strand:- start:9086 stop:9325 length:240 start_codon:yes stop_codon:yes gene_type:complete
MSDKQVVIYSTPTCHFCKQAKEFFAANNVEYTEHDVASDQEKAQEMVTRSGQMGVPVIFIGEEMVIGFDEERIKNLLGL